jgi:hypothetical protein
MIKVTWWRAEGKPGRGKVVGAVQLSDDSLQVDAGVEEMFDDLLDENDVKRDDLKGVAEALRDAPGLFGGPYLWVGVSER